MSFFVVKTIEEGKVFLTSVPSNWCDQKTLYFPNGDDWKKLRINRTPPEIDWKRYQCQVKGKYSKLEDALQAEKMFANFEDTEDEERYFMNLKEKRAHPARVLSEKTENNYNDRLIELSKQHSVATTSSTSNYSENYTSSEIDNSENDEADETVVKNSPYIEGHLDNLSEEVLLVNLPNVANSIEELKGDILKVNAKVDKILDILVNKVNVVKNTAFLDLDQKTQDAVEDNIFPIKSIEALNSLNEKLLENNFFKAALKQFSKEYIGLGYAWKKIAYLLIDNLVERQVLTSFTWTGSSKKQSKFSFSALINFNRLFYRIVKAGDSAYTQLNHEDFFKHSILKYSDARATAVVKTGLKRVSAPRVSVSRKKASINLSLEEPEEVEQDDKENADIHVEDEVFERE